MWLDSCPASTELLRQGDLLDGLILPRLSLPLPFARASEEKVSESHPIVLRAHRLSYYLAVSQCCTIESQRVVALAEVHSTQPLDADSTRSFELEEPFDDPELKYPFNFHPLDQVGEHLQRNNRRIYVADFTNIQTYRGEISILQAARVAAMTPEGRRLLRIRLSYFWSRPEGEDELWLTTKGLPVGSKAPNQASDPTAPSEDPGGSTAI
jgi:hypothetical protein